uniref:Phosphoglycerate mutase (2,3-diphosphoglycerate-dependent) n=1 Tax=Steinernema glaseri TaxID=37863 RepID=A0A1I7ZHW9_9BILA
MVLWANRNQMRNIVLMRHGSSLEYIEKEYSNSSGKDMRPFIEYHTKAESIPIRNLNLCYPIYTRKSELGEVQMSNAPFYKATISSYPDEVLEDVPDEKPKVEVD